MYVRIGFRLSSLDMGTYTLGYVDWSRFWVAPRARAQLGLVLGLGFRGAGRHACQYVGEGPRHIC